MSMLSAQCDDLRDTADKLDKTSAVSTPWIHYSLTPMMRNAADTIWQLRDDLQRANDAVQDAEHDESIAWDRVRKAEAENAKLRRAFNETLIRLVAANDVAVSSYMDDEYLELMRELGVEVDG